MSPQEDAPLLHLLEVTLCAVDTRAPALALEALGRSMRGVRYAEALLFAHDPAGRLAAQAPPGVRVIDIAPLDSIEAYSMFVLRELLPHVLSSHLLLIQWDGFVRDPRAWEPGFLSCDYIGAPWPQFPAGRSVGNGGFSLRSRKLLQALASPGLTLSHPEDLCICHQNREVLEKRYGVSFAPREMASRFSRERGQAQGEASFGFHGVFHFPQVLEPAELRSFIEELPAQMTRSLDARDLARELLRRGRPGDLPLARRLIRKRFDAGLRDARQWRLWAASMCRLVLGPR